MSSLQAVSIELDKYQDSLPQWAEALSTHVGRVLPSVRDQEVIRCSPIGFQRFTGQIEYGLLDDIVLAKLAAEPYSFTRSLRTATPTLPQPVLLLIQIGGSGRLAQHKRSCTLYPGDWSLLDTLHPFDSSSLGSPGEYQILGLERPSDPEVLTLLEQGVARRFDSKTGLSRVLRFTLAETFNQMHCLKHQSKKSLRAAIPAMTWDALREQLEGTPLMGRQDVRCARLKGYIESRLRDPELSVEGIAQACNASVRSVHRAFADDPAGSVWKYIWQRRLSHCAAELRDPRHANRSITDTCFSWGFNSSSHFSRLFKDQFGITPSEYRSAVWYASSLSSPARHTHTILAL
jgi:AraC-like DNA-binding protein